MPADSRGDIPKNDASNCSMFRTYPAFAVRVLPGMSGRGSTYDAADHRSGGTGSIASRPLIRTFQNSSGVSASPGIRQAIPNTAIGSAVALSRAARRRSSSTASSAKRFGERL
jgi:hypothetical protein